VSVRTCVSAYIRTPSRKYYSYVYRPILDKSFNKPRRIRSAGYEKRIAELLDKEKVTVEKSQGKLSLWRPI